jgi:hypothetical protein
MKSGTPVPPPRGQSPIRTNGRIDMEKMRAMEDALRKKAAERKQGDHRWRPEPKAPAAPKAPPPTAPAPAAP